MKFIFVMVLIMSKIAFGSDIEIATKILDRTVLALFKTETVAVWAELPTQKAIIKNSSIMQLVETPEEAKLIIVSAKKPEGLSSNTILFATRYEMLFDEDVIGAFFWQKGRPNLVFIRQRLEKKKIKIAKEFEKYVEEDI